MNIRIYDYLPEGSMKIRMTVFVEEQGFVDKPDEIDKTAIHIVGCEDDIEIATCRVFRKEGSNDYILGRFAVVKEYRGKGRGRELLYEAEKYVASVSGASLILHSQYHAKDFYAKFGYELSGDIEYEQGEPHVWMVKQMKSGY